MVKNGRMDGSTSLRMHFGRCALSASVSLQCKRKRWKETQFSVSNMPKIAHICNSSKYVKYARNILLIVSHPTCFHVCCLTRSPATLKCFTLNFLIIVRICNSDDWSCWNVELWKEQEFFVEKSSDRENTNLFTLKEDTNENGLLNNNYPGGK